MDLNRRNFLKVVGVTAAASALPGCEREVHRLVPYLLPDDEIVPGIDTWYASICQECEAGCGTIVRTREGRAKKIEGNPRHPVNRGKLCAIGQAALQGLYNPDRIRSPLKRDRDGVFHSIGWDEGLALWTDQLRQHHGRAAMISHSLSGTLGDVFSEFMDAIAGKLLCYDTSGVLPILSANSASFGVDRRNALPDYDLAQTDYLLSFGAPFLEHWLSPVGFGVAYGHMRQGRPGIRGRFIQIEPRLSLTAANADRWIPIRPGTEGLLAMGIGRIILREGGSRLPPSARKRFEPVFESYSLDRIAADTEVAEDEIIRLAREFSRASAPLAIGGGIAAAQTNGTSQLMAINSLNVLVGNIGQVGGIRFYPSPSLPVGASHARVVGEQGLLDLAREFRDGKRAILHLYHSNPLFMLPPSTPVQDLFEKAEFIVSFSSFMDESTARADLILPDHVSLESWSDHVQSGMVSGQAAGIGQPVIVPLYDTRPVGDVFLLIARRLDERRDRRFPGKTFYDLLQDRWKTFLAHTNMGEDVEEAWTRTLQQGGWWNEQAKPLTIGASPPPAYEQAVFDGTDQQFPFYFYPYPSVALYDGRGANRPWLQELPDPLSTAVWGSWVDMNPVTAKAHGLQQGDLVRVISPYGTVEAPVVVSPGMRPDLISMPIGQGHRAYGRYAADRGVNPLTLLGPAMDTRSGCLATGSTRVRIEPTGKQGRLVLLDQTGKSSGSDLIRIDRKV
ncbi:MAG: molybdopterin-dependent oxidoreductase [Nitrospiraceae bacterium]